jgi:hypothetical protein
VNAVSLAVAEPRDSIRLAAIARLMVGAVMLWALWLTYRHRHQHAGGTVIVDWTPFAVDACKKIPVDGPDEHSIGADLLSSDGKVLRVIRKGGVAQLWLFAKSPGGAAIPINQSDCSEWKVDLSWDDPGSSRGDSGDLSLTCKVGGHKLNGEAHFNDCPAK